MRYPLLAVAALAGCTQTPIGQAPAFTEPVATPETTAMTYAAPIPTVLPPLARAASSASLWSAASPAVLGRARARERGDLLTVVIDIDDSARVQNASARSREGEQAMEVGGLLGAGALPGVDLGSSSSFSGDGTIRRAEQLELRVAATVVDVLPNGVLAISGSQEVRVNFEMRELMVTGYVRPQDITATNEVAYDRIAQARIAYGGRGQITDMQQPRYGQQAAELALPF